MKIVLRLYTHRPPPPQPLRLPSPRLGPWADLEVTVTHALVPVLATARRSMVTQEGKKGQGSWQICPSSVSSQQWNLGQVSGPLRTLSARVWFDSVSLNAVFWVLCGDAKPRGHTLALSSSRLLTLPLPSPLPFLLPLLPEPGFAFETSAAPCFLFPGSLLQAPQLLPLSDFLLVPRCFPYPESALCHPSRACCQSVWAPVLKSLLGPTPKFDLSQYIFELLQPERFDTIHYGNPWHIETWTLPTLTKCGVKSLKAPLQFILSFTRRPSSALM